MRSNVVSFSLSPFSPFLSLCFGSSRQRKAYSATVPNRGRISFFTAVLSKTEKDVFGNAWLHGSKRNMHWHKIKYEAKTYFFLVFRPDRRWLGAVLAKKWSYVYMCPITHANLRTFIAPRAIAFLPVIGALANEKRDGRCRFFMTLSFRHLSSIGARGDMGWY